MIFREIAHYSVLTIELIIHSSHPPGCDVTPDVNISAQKFNIKLFVPSSEGLMEQWLRAENESQYAKWMAAFRLATKGKTMADSSYESEVQSILAFLSMQHPSNAPVLDSSQFSLPPEDFVAPRYVRKLKSKQVIIYSKAVYDEGI